MGYCTLRNGSLHSQSPMNMGMNNIGAMNPVSNVFHNPSSNTCTLPRHHNNQWPSYGGTIAGVRNVSQTITISGSQQPQNSNQLMAMHNLGPARPPRVCMVSEDDSEIPLMAKRDSTV
jgi:hypothetical protein